MVLAAVDIHDLHALLDSLDGRHEALTIEAIGIQLVWRLIGRGDDDHALLEHHLKQAPQDNRIANISHEQLVEAQHPDLLAQRAGQCLQRIGGSVELVEPDMHPSHEMMKVLPT